MKNVSVLTAIALSTLFFACEEESIPVPLPPPSQTAGNEPAPAEEKRVEAPPPSVAEKPSEPVKAVKAPPPAKEPARTITYYGSDDTEQLSKGRYIIQVGIFPTEASARKLIKKLANDGIKAYNARVENPDPDKGMFGTYNRVRIGFFEARSNAEAFAKARLEPLGYKWWIDKGRNDNVGKIVSYEPEEQPTQQAPKKTPEQMTEQEKREAAIAAAKEEYKAIAKAANAAVSGKAIPPPTVPPKAPKAPPPPPAKAPPPKLAPPPPESVESKNTDKAAAKLKKIKKKEAEVDSRGRVKMK